MENIYNKVISQKYSVIYITDDEIKELQQADGKKMAIFIDENLIEKKMDLLDAYILSSQEVRVYKLNIDEIEKFKELSR
ncbi:MAG: hypothetical protein U9Q33_04430 [Campylobacterota bacterium]|nr:hypothetical protein [Campylobacterota bacterium]